MQAQTSVSVKNYLNREQLQLRAAQCTLFLSVTQHRLCLLMVDMARKEVLGLTVIETGHIKTANAPAWQLTEWLNQAEFAKSDFQQTVLLIENSCYTILPEPLFVAEKATSYLQLVQQIPAGYQTLFNRTNQRVCICAAPGQLLQNIKQIYPGLSIQHTAGIYVESIFNSVSKSEKDMLHVLMHANYMDVVHIKNGQLQFINTFPFEADTDIVYFLLSVAEQQKMNHDKLGILLSGDVSQTGTLVQMLKKYIPEVLLQTRPDEFTYPASFREFQDQQYYASIAALLCEL